MDLIMKLFKKIKDVISASILCLRFPFLYPRNRFDGKYHARLLSTPKWKTNIKAFQNVYITAKVVDSNEKRTGILSFFRYNVKWNKQDNRIVVYNDNESHEFDIATIVNDSKFEILGLELKFIMTGDPVIVICLMNTDSEDKTKYGFVQRHVTFIKSKWYKFLNKIVTFIDEKILDKIFIFPSYTELDAMDAGWKKAFGIQMCKEIKKELKKHKFLYKYRIVQIKEKWGYLHWYDGGVPKDSKIWDIIHKYEDISRKTCVVCGKPATKMSTGWISPYCDDCVVPGRKYTEIK
jgi:hypothetical protein